MYTLVCRMAGIDDKLLQEVIHFLEVFKTASLELEATKTPTLHLALPWFYKLKSHCQANQSDSAEVATMKKKAMVWMDSKYILQPLHNVAAALNPKMRNLKMLPDETKTLIYNTIRMMIKHVSTPNDQLGILSDIICNYLRTARYICEL
jgi:hypothetical protein